MVQVCSADALAYATWAGNVWEWTSDDFTLSHAEGGCCAPVLEEAIPRRVIKGGSHLCAPSYCLR